MSNPVEEFPMLSIEDIRLLDQRDKEEMNKEKVVISSFNSHKNAELEVKLIKK